MLFRSIGLIYSVYHLEVVLLISIFKPYIKPIKSILRALSLLPLGGLSLLLSFGGVASQLQKRNRGFKGSRKLGFKNG